MAFTQDQIKAELQKNSNFTFEMQIVSLMRKLRFECEHSGTYVDPIKEKNREFDIRAIYVPSQGARWNFAIECKNIVNTPLVVHRAPRSVKESFHQTLLTKEGVTAGDGESYFGEAHIKVVQSPMSPYRKNEYVGKSMDQCVPDGKNGVKLSDAEIFDRFTQALNSLGAMVKDVSESTTRDLNHAFIPVLVVPNGSLWAIDYKSDGGISEEVHQVSHVQYYINRAYPFKAHPDHGKLVVTHLEIVTPDGLEELCKNYTLCF